MPAEVGGRLVAVAPQRSLFAPDYVRLLLLLAIASAVHIWLVVHTAVPARDSIGYARLALNLSDPNAGSGTEKPRQRIEVVRTAEQPPGYPIAVWATEKVLRFSTDLSLPERALLATQTANGLAAILLVVPLYLIGRILFNRNVGFAAALLFQVLPVPARVTSDGLSEGVYLLAAAVAIFLGVRAARRPGIGICLLCGMATGASYLVRPEGLLIAVAVTLVFVGAAVTRRWPRDATLGRLTALGVGIALIAVPYMVLIGGFTRQPTADYIINPFNEHPAKIWREQPGARAPVGGSVALFAEWWDPKIDDGTSRVVWALRATGKEVVKALHYVVAALAVFGLIATRRQLFSPDLGLWVLIILGAMSCGLLLYLATRIGYVSERHTLLFVMISCVFAAAALEPLARVLQSLPGVGRLVWPRFAPQGILLTIVVAALPFTLKTMHAQREGHKHAGLWLSQHIQEDDWLVDPFTWGEWYAGRTLYRTVEYKGQPASTYVIVEEGKTSPHSRLPQWEHAKELKQHGERVYHWPEHVPVERATVHVYRVVHKSP